MRHKLAVTSKCADLIPWDKFSSTWPQISKVLKNLKKPTTNKTIESSEVLWCSLPDLTFSSSGPLSTHWLSLASNRFCDSLSGRVGKDWLAPELKSKQRQQQFCNSSSCFFSDICGIVKLLRSKVNQKTYTANYERPQLPTPTLQASSNQQTEALPVPGHYSSNGKPAQISDQKGHTEHRAAGTQVERKPERWVLAGRKTPCHLPPLGNARAFCWPSSYCTRAPCCLPKRPALA